MLEAGPEGGEGEPTEPHEVALAREEVNMLLAEQRKTAALKVRDGQRVHVLSRVLRVANAL